MQEAEGRGSPCRGFRRRLAVVAGLAGVLLLASCGGGGPTTRSGSPSTPGGTSSPVPPSPGTPSPVPGDLANHREYRDKYFANHPEYRPVIRPGGIERRWGLAEVRAADAYARIAQREDPQREGPSVAPGAGVTVGVMDTGIDEGHWEFDPALVSEEILEGDGDATGSRWSHGTSVASVIVAQRDGRPPDPPPSVDHIDDGRPPDPSGGARPNFHGVAWGARLKMYALTLGSDDGPYMPVDVDGLGTDDYAAWFNRAFDDGVDVLNLSWGFSGLIEHYGEAELRRNHQAAIEALAQARRTEKTLVVVAAGNSNGRECEPETDGCEEVRPGEYGIRANSPEVLPGLPLRIAELRSHVVAVAATGRDGGLASFSNPCGMAAKWCMAAPGEEILTALYRPSEGRRDYGLSSGTSFAAPYVTGGLAVLQHYFRNQMTNTQILTRLYRTATVAPDPVAPGGQCPAHLDTDGDGSRCELSSTHGWGLMNLDAATRPVGGAGVALDGSLRGRRVVASASFLRGGPALGDSLASALRGRSVALFDELDAPFWVGLDNLAGAAASPSLPARLSRFLAPGAETRGRDGLRVSAAPGVAGGVVEVPWRRSRLRLGFNRASGERGWSGGHAGLAPLARGGLSLTVGAGALEASTFTAASGLDRRGGGRGSVTGAVTGWRPPDSPLGLRLGFLRESDRALGTSAGGAFGRLAAGVSFGGVGLSARVGPWRLSADGELGSVRPEARHGIVRGVSRLVTSAFSLAAERSLGDGERLRLSASQPLRVERGRARLSIPTGRTPDGAVTRSMVAAPLSPSGRQVDLAGEWSRPLAPGGELRLGATLSLQPGHETGRPPDFLLLAGYRLAF